MSRAEYICKIYPMRGYWSASGGIEVHHIAGDETQFCYCVSQAWTQPKIYHALQIYKNSKDEEYVVLNGVRHYFKELVEI